MANSNDYVERLHTRAYARQFANTLNLTFGTQGAPKLSMSNKQHQRQATALRMSGLDLCVWDLEQRKPDSDRRHCRYVHWRFYENDIVRATIDDAMIVAWPRSNIMLTPYNYLRAEITATSGEMYQLLQWLIEYSLAGVSPTNEWSVTGMPVWPFTGAYTDRPTYEWTPGASELHDERFKVRSAQEERRKRAREAKTT